MTVGARAIAGVSTTDRTTDAATPEHPAILDATERPLGTWTLQSDRFGPRPYGRITLVRLDGRPKYRTEVDGRLIG